MVLKELFGGAIVAELSSTLVDVSVLRQVPDNQEVFLYPDSDVSIVIEVLQRIPESIDEKAVKFHFEALAHDNDAISSAMQLPFVMHNDQGGQTPSPIILHGSQRIHKFNARTADDVDVLVALFRVHSEGKSADLVVSVNIPRSSDGSVEERHATITSDFNSLVSSLRIIDYNLFR
ncbi:hypothetical protein HD554DRAFT_2116315 [Boletus coccyginus]|nr:hypothetical protein HD554DRAFT_2116315 [Boletus coccyginus]